jgi:hypothetical protein
LNGVTTLTFVAQPGSYPLLVDPTVGNKSLSKVLMDGCSNLNILYVEILNAMGISRSKLRTSIFPFLGIILGMRAYPMGNIELSITFGDCNNFRTETLIFEVVDFEGSFHAILGCPCYAKFMAVPNYTFLKLKMPGPNDVITVSGSFGQAYTSGWEHFELTTTLANSTELQRLRQMVTEGAPDSNELTSSSDFRPTQGEARHGCSLRYLKEKLLIYFSSLKRDR